MTAGFLGPKVHCTGELVDLSETGVLIECPELLVRPQTMGHFGINTGHEILRSVAVARRRVPGVGIAFQFTQMGQHDRKLLHGLLSPALEKSRPA
jgi:hypothetical protein